MKTPDEIKKGLECCVSGDCPEEDCPYYKCQDDMWCGEQKSRDAMAYIQQLEAQVPRWISVEERLPDVDVDVVLIIPRIDGPCIRVGWLRKTGRWWAAGQGIVPYEVTHWMPMPEPPEA